MRIELEVYSNEQWQGPDRKGNYIVKGDLGSLRAFVLRWQEKDRARDPEGMTVYHCFTVDPFGKLCDDDVAEIGQEAFSDFLRLINPWMFDLCPHGMSAWLCEGPQHYPLDM